MNKTALKNFATWSRRKLIEQVQMKAFLYGIDEKNGLLIEEQFGQLVINGKTYPLSMKSSFTALQKQLEQKGYKQLLEEVAYTWFNRIIAIRYMEVHEYLPEKVNVLSSSVGRVDPDILFEFDTMDLAIDETKVRELVNTGDTEAAFRLLFVAQCNALNTILPFMFEKIQDYTELLLPDFLLDAESVIKTLVQSEDLTESFEEIEVIGWLYQYYIAEEKDRVFAQKSKYKKEEIPFATQLFTPKWIVQYMVQNSLGRYWTEAHREDEDLIDKWEYFIKHEEEDFHEKIAPYVNKELKVEDIKLLDPAMGSGHILVYAFEVFHEIYEKCGYPEREIPRLILENNLYGLDIDDRAYQLASFAVVMKAASYSKRFLRSIDRDGITLNLASIQETNHISDEVIAYIAQQESGERYNEVKSFFDQYHNAKTYGSLINITERDLEFIKERFEQIVNNPVHDLFYAEQHEIAREVLPELIYQTKVLRNKYDVVVMNPPYMGTKKMEKKLADFINENYSKNSQDLFSSMMASALNFTKNNGQIGQITPHSWMFLTTYLEFREQIYNWFHIDTLVHLGTDAFEELKGEVVQTVTCVFRKSSNLNLNSICKRLVEVESSEEKRLGFFKNNYTYEFNQVLSKKITGSPFSYWADDQIREIYSTNISLGELAEVKKGMFTGDNNKFLRLWFEVDYNKIGFNIENLNVAHNSEYRYFPLNKGGTYRNWYGNQEYVIKFDEESYYEIDSNKGHRSAQFYFQEALTWTKLTNNGLSVRYSSEGFINNDASMAIYKKDIDLLVLLGFLNSNVAKHLLSFISPTMNYNQGDLVRLPIKMEILNHREEIIELVNECIQISKDDWDSNEVSWNFKSNKLLKHVCSENISDAYSKYYNESIKEITKLKLAQSKLDDIFSRIYNLKITHKKELPLSKKIIKEDEAAKEFLLYFVGSVMGRYGSSNQIRHLTFTEKEFFKDDIIAYLKDFLKSSNLNAIDKNLSWLAKSINEKSKDDPETILRKYFIDKFYGDHCKLYQNKPIYWLVDSGKQKGLRTLIYMHRYTPDTMATIRFEHLQEIQAKYQQEIADLENRIVNPNLSATDKKKLNAEKVAFEKKIDELREFDKRLAAIAAEEIEIDLDDGVKVNYEKFYRGGKGVLAKIK